jgi:FHA domain
MATLIELTGARRRFSISSRGLVIGRGEDNDVILDEEGVSRSHARISWHEKGFYLVDHGSANGTFFDGKSIRKVHLRSGDRFTIGRSQFEFSGQDREHIPQEVHIIVPPRPEPPPHPPEGSGGGPDNAPATPWYQSPYAKWGGIGSGVLILLLLVIFFAPLYAVQTGDIATCEFCGKEYRNTVETLHVGFFDRDKYRIARTGDFCPVCGMQDVAYKENTLCEHCGRAYVVVEKTAPRRTRPRDQNTRQGYCDDCKTEVVYFVRTTCLNCGKVYQSEQRHAPKYTDPRDQTENAGFCSGTCKLAYETKNILKGGSNLMDKLDPGKSLLDKLIH